MDLADMERVRQALRKNGEAFALRICTPDEWAYCRKHGDAGVPSILLHGAAGVTARELGITGWFLTMTHSRLSAAATVIALAQ